MSSLAIGTAGPEGLFATDIQKGFTYAGYYLSGFGRQAAYCVESLTRFVPSKEGWEAAVERIKTVAALVFYAPLALLCGPIGLACYSVAALLGPGRFEWIKPDRYESLPEWDFGPTNVLTIASWNACFQEPWSILSGGVIPPKELVAVGESRCTAVAETIGKVLLPDIFMGQEFDDLGSQDTAISRLRSLGYQFFFRDLGCNDPVRNGSGLFLASRVPVRHIEFIPFRREDTAGTLGKLCNRGILVATIPMGETEVKVVNIHLNYSVTEECKEARKIQLRDYVRPLLLEGSTIAIGDANSDTSEVPLDTADLGHCVNAFEGEATCTDEGKHLFRGSSREGCVDCAEKIDVLIYDPKRIEVTGKKVQQFVQNGLFLSDHSALSATIRPLQPIAPRALAER